MLRGLASTGFLTPVLYVSDVLRILMPRLTCCIVHQHMECQIPPVRYRLRARDHRLTGPIN
jgi:hypothetical protein